MYTTFYNLRSRPFENIPDPNFLYLSRQHREVLYSLIYGIESAKGFILLAGEVGTGKTTLVRALLKEINAKHVVISVVNPQVGFADIFAHLSRKLEIAGVGRVGLGDLELLAESLTTLHEEGKKVVLLIDEAHLLAEETLEGIRLLSNIESDQAKLIQIVLIGQNEIYDLLSRGSQKSLQQRIVVNRQLRPLTWDETGGYIVHRLAEAGRGAELFNRNAVSMIWRYSGGTPRLISQICDNALVTGYALEAKVIGRGIIQEVLDDMGPMRPRALRPFFCLPVSSWPSWSFAACGLLLLLGLGVVGLIGKEKGSVPADAIAATKSPVAMAQFPSPPPPSLVIPPGKAVVVAPAPVAEVAPPPRPSTPTIQVVAGPGETVGPTLAPVAPPPTGARVIPPDETLGAMAVKTYGVASETVLDLIQMANKGLADLNRVRDGQSVLFPVITRESMLARGEDGRLHIHYASFYALDNARRVTERFQREGLDSFFLASRQGTGQVFRVYVGSFARREEAERLLNTIEFKNLPFLNGKGQIKG